MAETKTREHTRLTPAQYRLLRKIAGGAASVERREERTANVLERLELITLTPNTADWQTTWRGDDYLKHHHPVDGKITECERRDRISMSTVRDEFGLTPKMIEQYLPGPMLAPNPHYRSAAPMKLWFRDEVEAIADDETIKALKAANDERKARREQAAAERARQQEEEFRRRVDDAISRLHVRQQPYEQVLKASVDEKQEYYELSGQWNERADWANDATKKRWMIAHIRYNMIDGFDNALWKQKACVDDKKNAQYTSEYKRYYQTVLNKIGESYPQLEDVLKGLRVSGFARDDDNIGRQIQKLRGGQSFQTRDDDARIAQKIEQLEQEIQQIISQPLPRAALSAKQVKKKTGVPDSWLRAHEDDLVFIRSDGKRSHSRHGGGVNYDSVKLGEALQRDYPERYDRYRQSLFASINGRQQRDLNSKRSQLAQLKRELGRGKRREYAMTIVPAARAAIDPIGYYAATRCENRSFILHIGPTNSGKTHDALQALVEAGEGVYLAPLRLLALETGERLRTDGHPCSIVTGEEQSWQKDADFLSETVEMADVRQPHKMAVVDECQMIADEDRGGAWARAIMGLNAPVIHLCMSADAENIIRQLIALCGDTCRVIRHERQTPLIADVPMDWTDPKKGDALVAFSRRAVLEKASQIEKRGVTTSVIYGALPWPARREEARRFAEGESQVLVATDAIGMGLNLPIRRVVFTELSKFDGHEKRALKPSEIKQIAGRAGRRGMYDEGHVTTSISEQMNRRVKNGLEREDPPIAFIRLAFPRSLGLDEGADLSMILKVWASIPTTNPIMVREDVSNARTVAKWLEDRLAGSLGYGLSRKQVVALSFMPFDADDDVQFGWFADLVDHLDGMDDGQHSMLPGGNLWEIHFRNVPSKLSDLELRLKEVGVRFAFAKAMGFMDGEMADGFARTRQVLEREVIRKISGPKSALAEQRFRRDWDYYDDDDFGWDPRDWR